MSIAVANRYSRALADVVAKTGDYRTVLQELADFAAAYRSSPELREVCDTPALPLGGKLAVIEALTKRLGSSHVTLNFLRVLASHYRMALIEHVVESFRNIANERLGVVQVKISTAADLSKEEQELLRSRFSELTRKQTEIEFHLDHDLVGGIVAQIGSTVYDGSIRGRLERIRERLMQQ